ncbi:PKD domain-containing protein [Candidatus Solirubrobacter pratensis]|uniref:PKD domain-containing protein n=1 Tax=Candidatus Solirubrobacter pratensis TaxID=1298857 RepID=UPI00041C1671|nr:PKD domain-containing protein [Candidatus Solirubrobacter pratensis]
MPAIIVTADQNVAFMGQGRFRAPENPVDHLSKVPAARQTVAIDFRWTPQLAPLFYDDGTPTGTFSTQVNTLITFEGSFLPPPGPPRSIVRWEWNFGDGTKGVGQTVAHVFTTASPGVRVTLRTTDNFGDVVTVGHYMSLAQVTRFGVINLSGNSEVALTPTLPVKLTSLPLDASGSLAAMGIQATVRASVSVSASGSLTASGTQAAQLASAALSASGSLSGGGFQATKPGDSTLSATGTVVASATVLLAPIAVLADNFNSGSFGPQWTASLAFIDAGRAVIDKNSFFMSVRTYDFTNSTLALKVQPSGGFSGPPINAVIPCDLGITSATNSAAGLFFQYSDGTLSFLLNSTPVGSIAYNATSMAWLRLRESGGTSYFETSPDGTTWTQRASLATPALATQVKAYFSGGQGNTYIDMVNVLS